MKDFKSKIESSTIFSRNNSYIVKLERYMQDLLQFDGMLNSYVCEPQTRELFEQKDDLKFQMVSIQTANREIINAIRSDKEHETVQLDRIKSQMSMLEKLQAELKAYSASIMDNSKSVS